MPDQNRTQRRRHIVMLGSFGLWKKSTMGVRALPMAQALVRRGHRVTMIVPPWDDPAESGKIYTREGVRIVNLRVPEQSSAQHHLGYAAQLWTRTLAIRPDAVHIFKPKAHAGLAAYPIWLFSKWRWQVVVDEDDWEGNGGWNDLENFPAPQKAMIAWMERWGLTHSHTVTAASRALETLIWSLGVPRDRTFYVPNGVVHYYPERNTTMRAETRARYDIPADAPVGLLYTRFFEFKPERVAEIWARVVQALPTATLLVAGTGLHGEERIFQEAVCKAGIERQVRMLGWINRQDVGHLCAAADVGLYPFDDTLLNRTKCPVKLIDQLTTGLPVVGDKVGQIAEYIEQNRSGLVVSPEDNDAFTAALLRLLRDPAERARLGSAARDRMLNEFNWNTLVERVEQAYLPTPRS